MIDHLEHLIVRVVEPLKKKYAIQIKANKSSQFTMRSPTALIICLVDKLGIVRAIMFNVLASLPVRLDGILFCAILPVVSVNAW